MRVLRSLYTGLGIISLLAVLLYLPGIDGKYYGDDYMFVFKPLPESPFFHFTHTNESNVLAYRPIQAMIMVFTQKWYGMSTVPIHGISIIVHVLMIALVALMLKRLGFSDLTALAAAAVMAFSQVCVHAVMSNDTLSQSIGALSCLAAYACFTEYLRNKGKGQRGVFYLASLAFFLIALLSKETEISAIIGLTFIAVYMRFFDKLNKDPIRGVIFALIPFLVLTFLYYLVRSSISQVQAQMGDSRYQFGVGMNIATNLVQYFSAAVTPISTVTVMSAIKMKNMFILAAAASSVFLFLFAIVYGFFINRDRTSALCLFFFFGLAVINAFPVVALNHVSELYVYNSMPYIAALAGIGTGLAIESTKYRRLKPVIIMVCVCLICVNAASTLDKVFIMKNNGDRAARLIDEIRPYAETLPEHGKLVLVQTPADSFEYSVFLFNGFDVLEYGLKSIKYAANRPDISVEIQNVPDMKDFMKTDSHATVALALVNDTVTPVERPDYPQH